MAARVPLPTAKADDVQGRPRPPPGSRAPRDTAPATPATGPALRARRGRDAARGGGVGRGGPEDGPQPGRRISQVSVTVA